MFVRQVSDVAVLIASQHYFPRSCGAKDDVASTERVRTHAFCIPQSASRHIGLSAPNDEHLLAGADETQLQALGVSQPILARFQQDVAVLCPDLVHEAQFGIGRK
jgi:hypothetical protein